MIEAVDWITAPQRVTSPGGDTCQVYGWSDGVLVQFGIREGRLDLWRQRRIHGQSAQRYVRLTPPQWRQFAAENAALAAHLA